MDILDFLNSAYGKMVVGAWAIGLAVLIYVLLLIGRTIYFALFPSKRPWRTKSFDAEAEENRNKPLSSSSSESIGSLSARLGADIRDVWEMGYSDTQIDGVLTGRYTLEEMYKMGPEGNTTSSKGKEILGNKGLLAK